MMSGLSNLQLRVISAIVLAIVVLALTWAGGVWFRLLAAAIGVAIIYEWTSMSLAGRASGHHALLFGLVVMLAVLLVAGASMNLMLVTLAAAVAIAMAHAAYEKIGYWPAAGIAYAGLSAISLAAIRGGDASGLAATLFLFAIVWTTDIAAYFVGRSIGGPKLAPSISPGKTWSGAIGGTVGAVLVGLAVASGLGVSWHWAALLVLIVALSVVSQIGDLFESSFKRRFGAKDSSQLIPGHGGVMDRVDGLVVAALALFIIGAAFASAASPASALFI